jgi:excisionase family DNA binding protein
MAGTHPEPLLTTVRQAAGRAGVGRDAMYRLIREGRMPVVRIGRKRLVPVAALEDWVRTEARAETSDSRSNT